MSRREKEKGDEDLESNLERENLEYGVCKWRMRCPIRDLHSLFYRRMLVFLFPLSWFSLSLFPYWLVASFLLFIDWNRAFNVGIGWIEFRGFQGIFFPILSIVISTSLMLSCFSNRFESILSLVYFSWLSSLNVVHIYGDDHDANFDSNNICMYKCIYIIIWE